MLNFLYEIVGKLLWFCNSITGNYLFAILLFAVITKLLLFPLGIKQQKTQRRQAELAPKEAAIRKKYNGSNDKTSRDRMNQEIMELYQREKYSPFSGCLPLLIQLPIILLLYAVIRNPLSYISNYSGDKIDAIRNAVAACKDSLTGLSENALKLIESGASKIDQLNLTSILNNSENYRVISENLRTQYPIFTLENLPNFTVLGIDLGGTPSITSFNLLLLIPVLTFVFQFFGMKITKKLAYVQPAANKDAKMSGIFMDIAFPLITTWMTFLFPATLGIYWMFQNLVGVLQSFILKKMYPAPVFTEQDYKNAELALRGKAPKTQTTPQRTVEGKTYRSLHHIDDDDGDYPEIPYSSDEESDEHQKADGAPVIKDDNPNHKKNK